MKLTSIEAQLQWGQALSANRTPLHLAFPHQLHTLDTTDPKHLRLCEFVAIMQ